MRVLLVIKGEPDYQSDTVMHGLYSLLGDKLTHTSEYRLMYKNLTTPDELLTTSGRGFTIWGNLPEYLNDNSDIPEKIKNKYFDYIIYGSVRRCTDYYELASLYYPSNRIIMIDGEDDTHIISDIKNPLFKRELENERHGVFPISFAIPEDKIVKEVPVKIKELADYKPSNPGTGYIYNSEAEYYKNYQDATYAITHKKGGWDCMRHYEILANGCIPYFTDLNKCPSLTMANFPKDLILRSNNLYSSNVSEIDDILSSLLKYTKTHHRTIDLAKYILDKIKTL